MEEQPSLMDLRIGLYNDMVEKEVEGGKAVAIKAYRAAREESDHDAESDAGDKMSAALINRVDAMLQKLENEIDDVYAKIDDRWWLLDRDYDGKVTLEEVASAAIYLKQTLDKGEIQELIGKLSKNRGLSL